MHPSYPQFYRDLSAITSFEKVGALIDSEYAPEFSERLAAACNELFEQVLERADVYAVKHAAVVNYVLTLRESHTASGEKTASTDDEVTGLLTKLATAVYVDEVLGSEIQTLTGGAKQAALQTRLLGREYAVNLMRAILA